MSRWCLRICTGLTIVWVLLLGVAQPERSLASPFGLPQLASIAVPVEAERATVFADQSTVDTRLTPADFVRSIGPGRHQTLTHSLVPQAVLDRIKAAALVNPFAPRDDFARPSYDLFGGPLTPSPLVKFPGLVDLDGIEPPDMAIASSASWVVQGANDHFSVFNRSGVVQIGWPKSFAGFFHVPSPGSCDPMPFMSDPRAFYISTDQRFVIAALQVDGPIISTTCAPLSKYWIAVSQTNNPNGKWNVYAFNMLQAPGNVADFTQIGFDANGIYFSGNMYSSSSGFYQHATIFGAPKAKMEAGMSVIANGFTNLKAGGLLVDTVQPSIELTQPSTGTPQPVEYFINSKNILNCTAICSGVTVWSFANVLGSPTLTAANIATKTYSMPPAAKQPSGTINTDDQRISGTPVFEAGLISFGLTTAVKNSTTTVAGIFWGQVKPTLSGTTITGGSVFQSGYVSFTGNRSAYYPAIATDSRGNVYMAFGSSSSTLDASGYYAGRKTTDALGTIEPAVKLGSGTAVYPFKRWGDYSAAAIDGNTATSDAWFGVEFAVPSNWATEVGATRF